MRDDSKFDLRVRKPTLFGPQSQLTAYVSDIPTSMTLPLVIVDL